MEHDTEFTRFWLSSEQIRKLNQLGEEKSELPQDQWIAKVADTVFSFFSGLFRVKDHLLDDCFIVAIEKTIIRLSAYQPERGPLSNYLLRAIKNNYITELKNKQTAIRTGGMTHIEALGKEAPDNTERAGGPNEKKIPVLIVPINIQDENGAERENPDIFSGNAGIDRKRSPFDLHDEYSAYNQTLTAAIINYWVLLEKQRKPHQKGKTRDEEPKTMEDCFLYRMWYSEIEVQWLQMGLPCWEDRDISKAMNFSYLDIFLETDFMKRENQTVDSVKRSSFKSSVQTRFRKEPIETNLSGHASLPDPKMGFLPSKIAQEYAAAWAVTEHTSWEKGFPSDSKISKSRSEYLKWCGKLTGEREVR